MQLSGNNARTVADLAHHETGVLLSLDLEPALADRLMLLGFLPGEMVEAAQSAPGGDPRVYRVDGTEIALRRETALRLMLK
ncbi:MAG: FeoA family protein [Acidobacteria bacterium]|nr:FeoA family protein [Acidobacteriota bacterium]